MKSITNKMQWIVGLAAAALLLVAMPACKKKANEPTKQVDARSKTPAKAVKSVKVKDYVCGMTIDSSAATHKHEHKGHTYYFCNAGCFKMFKKDPEKYAALRAKDAPKDAPKAPAKAAAPKAAPTPAPAAR